MYLLDTCAWIDVFLSPDRLGSQAFQIFRGENILYLSAISPWEFCLLHSKGKIKIHQPLKEWLNSALPEAQIRILPLTPEVALEAINLPDFHKDPADRLIAATARIHSLTLLTCDRRLLEYSYIKSIQSRS